MRPVSALLNPHSDPNLKPLIFFAVSLPGREPLLSLSAGMNAHVEMLARLHPHTKFSHTKAKGSEGGNRGWKNQPLEDQRQRRLLPLTPPPCFIKICLLLQSYSHAISPQLAAETHSPMFFFLFVFTIHFRLEGDPCVYLLLLHAERIVWATVFKVYSVLITITVRTLKRAL